MCCQLTSHQCAGNFSSKRAILHNENFTSFFHFLFWKKILQDGGKYLRVWCEIIWKKLSAHWCDDNTFVYVFLLLTILRCWRNMKKWESMEMGLVWESMSEVEVEKVLNINMGMRKYVRSWESMRKHEKVWESIKYEKVWESIRYEKVGCIENVLSSHQCAGNFFQQAGNSAQRKSYFSFFHFSYFWIFTHDLTLWNTL